MNITILSSSKSSVGGVERFCAYLTRAYEEQGYSVSLLGREDLTAAEAKIAAWGKKIGIEQPVIGYFLGRKAMRRTSDLVVTNGMMGWSALNRPIINVQHGTFARSAERIDKGRHTPKYLVKRYVWGYFEGLAARRATQCVAVSDETRESVMTYYDVRNPVVILNAIDTELFRPMELPKKNQAIFVGRFEYAKGKDILEGMRQYLEKKDWQLIVAESMTQQELAVAYNESQVFLFPSLHEGCAYVLSEAMACGLPFLASPVGYVPTLIKEGKFLECIVQEQSLDAYISQFEKLIARSDGEKAAMANELRTYIIEKQSREQFSRSFVRLAETITNHD